VIRSSVLRPWSADRTGVPQRRQGRPARPYTQVSSPRRATPVVTMPNRSLFESSSRWARPTSGDVGDLADRAPRVDAPQEQHLGLVHVADAYRH
jgi:hypothetical protein